MQDDVKVAGIWATTVMVAILATVLSISSCTKDQNFKIAAFSKDCVTSGHRYVPSSSDTFGACI